MISTIILGALLSTMCTQEFTFLGVTNSTVWIIEDLSGECESSHLIQILIDDTSPMELSIRFTEYKKTKKFSEAFHDLESEQAQQLVNKKSVLWLGEQWSVEKPALNDSLFKSFSDETSGIPSEWDRNHDTEGIVLPLFRDCSATLLYSHPEGCYINYELDKGYFIAKKNLLIIFTKHPTRGAGGDTMHGFLVFQVK